MHRTICLGPVLSHVQYWRIKVLLPVVQRLFAIQESRNAKSSKRRRRSFRPKPRFTRVAWYKVGGGTMERNLAFLRLLKVSNWHNLSLGALFPYIPDFVSRLETKSLIRTNKTYVFGTSTFMIDSAFVVRAQSFTSLVMKIFGNAVY